MSVKIIEFILLKSKSFYLDNLFTLKLRRDIDRYLNKENVICIFKKSMS